MKIQCVTQRDSTSSSVILREVAESSRARLRGLDAVREKAKGKKRSKKEEERKTEELDSATYAQNDKKGKVLQQKMAQDDKKGVA